MKLNLSRTSILSLVAATLVAQACGGGGGDDDDTGPANLTSTTGSGTGLPANNVNTATSGGNVNTASATSGNPFTSNTTGSTTTGTGGSAGAPSTTGGGGEAGEPGTTTGEGGAPTETCEAPFEGGSAGAAGATATPLPSVVASFDEPGSSNGWTLAAPNATGNLLDLSLSRDASEGLSCAGAAALELPYDSYGDTESIDFNTIFGGPGSGANWTGATTLHVAMRFAEPESGNISHLAWGNLYLQSGDWSNWNAQGLDLGMLSDFEWHDITLDLTDLADGSDLSDIIKIGVQLAVQSTAPDSGPAVPPQTLVYIDDIWVE
jgi:hypothetical protein